MVRSLLARTAIELFAAKGYDNTTLDEVAAAAGVSRRTLFNYFRNKEDLALSGLDEQGDLIAARLAERPADEDAWTALRAAFQVLEEIDMTAEGRLEFITLLFGNDSLRAGHAEKQARWQDLFAPQIEPRLPYSDRRTLQARAIAAAVIICLQAANEEWVRLGGQVDLFDLYDTAVQAIHRPTWNRAAWGPGPEPSDRARQDRLPRGPLGRVRDQLSVGVGTAQASATARVSQ